MEQQDDPEDADPLLLFTPVALARVRRNGWSPERQIAFIAILARTGVVRIAAASVGMSPRSAYHLLNRVPFDHPFAQAWDTAMDRAREAALGHALRSLTEPQQVPVIHRGRIIGTRTWFDERLALAALRVSSTLTGPPESHAERRWGRKRLRDMAEMRANERVRREMAQAQQAPLPPPETPRASTPRPPRGENPGPRIRLF